MKQVLVIDDDATFQESIHYLLQSEGFSTVGAPDGTIGLKLAQQNIPDLILCDVQMPDFDGYQVLQALRQNPVTATVPFIFLTGKNRRSDLRHGMNLGADDYLIKPFSAEELLAAVNRRLEKQSLLHSQSQKQLTELRNSLTYIIPHELLTPLTGIMASVAVLRLHAPAMDQAIALEIADNIEESGKRLSRLLENTLLYAKLEITARDPERLERLQQESLDHPQWLITEIARQQAVKAGRLDDLVLDLNDAVLAMSESDFHRVLEEVINNAFKFSEPGTQVRITGTADADGFTLTVSDRGRGMTIEQIASIGAWMQFDRMQHEQQGAGMGLAIAKRLVELYGHRLTIESIPDQQTTVLITFATRHPSP
ncbi:MAG TPA: response regulator [Chroococcidiopsis sp.]